MDEVDNESLSVLMILDDDLFPQLLEWSANKGWSDLVIFLLETDYLRFKTNDMFESEPDKTGLYEPYHLIEKNSGGCFDKFFNPEQLSALKRLIDSGIPLNSVYSQICSAVWKEMLSRTGDIVHSPIWPTVRRSIVERHEISMEEMLADDMKRKYFDRYIHGDACDLAALQCLLSVRRIFASLKRFKDAVPSADGTSHEVQSGATKAAPTGQNAAPQQSTIFSYFGNKSNDDNQSIMKRWKASKTAIVSASKALQAPFSASTHSTHANNTSQNITTQQEFYTDPFAAFKILLEGTRQLQKQYFPSSTNLSAGSNSAFAAHSVHHANNNANGASGAQSPHVNNYNTTPRGQSVPNAQMDSSRGSIGGSGRPPLAYINVTPNNNHNPNHHGHSNSPRNSYPSHAAQARNCSGISEALRMEIQSTLTVNASVRTREIETVDRAFAIACAHMLDKQLHALEAEMLAYIGMIFAQFVDTTDYVLMVAQHRARLCRRIVDYTNKLEFLYDRVRQQKVVSWKDAQTRGKVFIAYDGLTIEGEELVRAADNPTSSARNQLLATQSTEGADMASSTVNINGVSNNSNEIDKQGRFNPNVVAISLEIVLPHTTMLTPSSVNSCARRVSVYTGGRGRRAVRLRAAPAVLTTMEEDPSEKNSGPATPILTLPNLSNVMSAMQGVSQSVSSAGSQLYTRSFLGNVLGGSPGTAQTKGLQAPAEGIPTNENEAHGVPLATSSADSSDSASDVVSHNPFQSGLNLRINTGEAIVLPSTVRASTPSALSALSTSSSPAKAPMRRAGSVQFRLAEDKPEVSVRPASGTVSDNTSAGKGADDANAAVTVPVVNAEDEGMELRREERSVSMDSVEHDNDTLSELPSISMKMRSAANLKDVTSTNSDFGNFGGSSIFEDIVNAPSGAPINNNTVGSGGSSGKYFVGSGYFDTDNIAPSKEDDSSSEDSLISDVNSDSSSDYEGDVRHVFSTTDLDQLIRLGNDGSSPSPSPFPDLAPRSIATPSLSVSRSRSGSKSYNRSRVPSLRNLSRVGSSSSVQTGITNTTGRTSTNPNSGKYDNGMRRMTAVDLTKLDRVLHKEVLGSRTVPAGVDRSTSSGAKGLSSAAGTTNRAVKSKHLVASLAVALAAVFADSSESFGRKFTTPVEESFTFTTDTKGLELLNDLLFSKQPSFMGAERADSYAAAFERATSVFRQNSMLDTARPQYRVCVQVLVEIVTPQRAAILKTQLLQLNTNAAGGMPSPRTVPLHPSHGSHTVASRIPHSVVRIGISYAQLVPQHAMISALSSIAFRACDMLVSGSSGNDQTGVEESKSSNECLEPLPLKLRYTDAFLEYLSPTSKPSAFSKESLYELYLGTLPAPRSGLPQSNNSEGNSPFSSSVRDTTLCAPITHHLGVCDFSLCDVVTALSTRLTLQILMLVMVDRPVLLVSASSTLLSKVQVAIPRLIWPFRIDNTTVIRQILSPAELHHFVYRHDVPFVSETQQPVIREKKLNRKSSSWRETITRIATNVSRSLTSSGANNSSSHLNDRTTSGNNTGNDNLPLGMRSPRNSFHRRRTSSSGDLLAGMHRRPSATSVLGSDDGINGGTSGATSGTNSPIGLMIDVSSAKTAFSDNSSNGNNNSTHKAFQRILTPPSLHLPSSPGQGNQDRGEFSADEEVTVDQHSCILGVDAAAFYNAPPELREELENMRIRGSGFTFIDIDSGLILNRRPDEFCDAEDAPKPLPSRLSDPEMFRCSNFGIYRSLVKTINQIHDHLLSTTRALLRASISGTLHDEHNELPDADYLASRLAERVVGTNREVEKAFYAFWSEMVLRALPKNIQHFPGPKVISCDIRAVLTELLHSVVASSASMDMGEDAEDMLAPPAGDSLASFSPHLGRKRSPSGASSIASESQVSGGTVLGDSTLNYYLNKQLPAALPDSAMFANMNSLPFEEFLALFVEQVADHGETNMCYAFYKEFIADGSVVFKDLLTRHSSVLDRWSI